MPTTNPRITAAVSALVLAVALIALALTRTSQKVEAYPWSAHECETVSASFSKWPMVGPGGITVKLTANGRTYYGEVHDEWWRTSRLVHFHGAHIPFSHTQGYAVSAKASVTFKSSLGFTYTGTKTDSLVHYHDAWRGNDCSLGSISIG